MRFRLVVIFLGIQPLLHAQELFIFSEPASTMPKKAIMFRMNSRHFSNSSGYYYKLNPELGYGFTKNIMGHIEGYYSNWALQHAGSLDAVGINAKYRVLSIDKHHAHKRLAFTARAVYAFNPLPFEWMLGEGNTSLLSFGTIYTQLIHRLAVSGKLLYVKPIQQWNRNHGHAIDGDVLEWQFSTGLLVFPLHYKSFNQVNMNIYAEYLGQKNIGLAYAVDRPVSHGINHDLGLGAQFIFASRLTAELAYRFNLGGTMNRMTNYMYYFNIEYMLFR